MPAYKILFNCFLTVLTVMMMVAKNDGENLIPPCMGRQILNTSYGIISDGTREYHPSSHCEWLIIGGPKKFINLQFVSMSTECTYDYLFVHDGASFDDELIGAFSGESDPGTLVAKSGYMMVYFFSDRNYVRQGFRAEFYTSDCPRNCSKHGRCNAKTRSCECGSNFLGEGCQHPVCSNSCMGGANNCSTNECWCRDNLPNSKCDNSTPGRKLISENGFKKRAGLSGAHVSSLDRLLLFGGFDLQRSLDDLFFYDFKTYSWNVVEKEKEADWPVGRHGHTMGIFGDRVVFMFGGCLNDTHFSSELWMFDVFSGIWKLLDVQSLPPITGHAMTITNDGWLYILGGMTENGTFLSNFWRCNISHLMNEKNHQSDLKVFWERLNPIGGITADRRLVGHSMVHDSPTNRLLVFGGITVDSARFPRRSPMLQIYHVTENWWTDLSLFGKHVFVPRERAFHQATMIGEYMVVVGGNVHSHHEDEHCYDGDIFFLHLRCMTWVDGSKFIEGPRQKFRGRYSHFATFKSYNTVLVAGGFRGSLLGSLEAYILPENMVVSSDESKNSGYKCALHQSKEICIVDPNCLWCSMGLTQSCISRMSSEICSSGPMEQSVCPGICDSLKTCESCTIFGQNIIPSLDDCAWCVLDSKCGKISRKCSVGPNTSTHEGWWKDRQTQLVDVTRCIVDNKPPGLLWLRYKNPANLKILDEVDLVRNSTQMFHFNTPMDKEYQQEFTYMARMVGFIHPPKTGLPLLISVFGSTVSVWLYLSNDSLTNHKELVAESKISTYFSIEAKRPNGQPLFTSNVTRYYMEMIVNQTTAPSSSLMSVEVGLRWNITSNLFRKNPVIGTEFLEPPSDGNCSLLNTCMSCMIDFSCGWCVDSCVTRSLVVQSPGHRCYPTSRSSQYFVTNLTHCTSCSNHTNCFECLVDPSCEWSVMEARCFRIGQFNESLVDVNSCPMPCYMRNNVTWCLKDENECAWCEDTQRCFSFVEYIPRYPYGGCRMWVDSATDIVPLFDCTSIRNCSSCIYTHLCGWCYLKANPSLGVCHRGDFTGPYDNITCDSALSNSLKQNLSIDSVSWSYEQCEDVDECALGVHDCHDNAKCINTHGSFNCTCERGFIGDGVEECEKTCDNVCTNGNCSGPPDYTCDCDIGWTGPSCDVDCNCNFHSTCLTGVCDDCLHGTQGSNCQFCMIGFYGNSSLARGCVPCECNGHADEEAGLCSSHDGACYCKDNTAGHNCQICADGYYGNPGDSGRCFRECEGRSIILGVTEGGLGTANLKDPSIHRFCLWILTTSDRPDFHQSTPEVIALTIHKDANISCARDRLYIYNGLPDNFGIPSLGDGSLLGAVCGDDLRDDLLFRAAPRRPLVIFFEFIQTVSNLPGSGFYGFNASYRVTFEPDSCDASCENPQQPSPLPFQPSNNLTTDASTGIQTCIIYSRCEPLEVNSLLGSTTIHCSGGGMNGAFMFGGKNLVGPTNDLWFMADENPGWKKPLHPRGKTRPSPRYFHASECLRDESMILIHGGVLVDGTTSDEMWSFNLESSVWSLMESSRSPSLAGHTLTLTEDKHLLAIGGLPFLGNSVVLHEFDPNTSTWKDLPGVLQLQGVYGHSVAYNSRDHVIYIYGGYQWEEHSGFHLSNRLHSLNLEGHHANSIAYDGDLHYQPPPSTLHSSFFLDDLLILIGGRPSAPLYHAYLPPCDMWMKLDPSGISLPNGLQYFGNFWSNGDSIFGSGASGSLRKGGVTRLDFGGDVYRLVRESKRCLDEPRCSLCSVKNSEEVCLTNTVTDQQCFKVGHQKHQARGNPSMDCPSLALKVSCTNGCLWCNKCSKCISVTDDCRKSCGVAIFNSSDNNVGCRSFVNCSDCLKEEGCAWRSPRCDQRGCTPGRCQNKSTNSSGKCPSPCNQHLTCSSCLNIDTTCLWSVTMSKCYSAYEVGLLCTFGECGSLISSGERSLCPGGCGNESSCSSCLKKPHCGWCSVRRGEHDPGGVGVCMEGGLNGPRFNTCLDTPDYEDSDSSTPGLASVGWSFMVCPPENECQNGHHTCDKASQYCEDREDGFVCRCKQGFNFNPEVGRCMPHCTNGCLHGTCVSPDSCRCTFGFVGVNCSMECKCNRHSECESDLNRDKCISCHNNTMGDTCEKCRPLFVGNPQNGGKCESCLKYCNEHSRICLSREEFNHTLNYPDLPTNEENIRQWLRYGSFDSKNTKCLSCTNSTQGDRCEKCKPGHFRQPHLTPFTACQQCLCNGHSDYCDPEKGDGCDCRNNTKSPRCDSSDSSKLCYKVQCSQCVDNFLGTPTDGHQCYRQMSVESQHCFDPLTQMNCNPTRDPDPLLRNRTVFFAIQPKYLNVNIRIFIDVTRGGLNLYFAPFDNAFQVFVNPKDGIHKVVVDPTYKLYDPKNRVTINSDLDEDYDDQSKDQRDPNNKNSDDNENDDDDDDEDDVDSEDDEEKENQSETPATDRYFPSVKYVGGRPRRGFTSVSSSRSKKFGAGQNRERNPFTSSTAIPHKMFLQNSDKQSGSDKFFHLERVRAEGLTTFVTVDKPETFLFVENIINRLVVILPNNVHPLKVARFYLVLVGVHTESYGSVYMRQDQPHIDLFVFFSVFFSCFFLFLAVCVLLWKAKQMNDARRSRHRSLLEMEHMASRPSAHVIVVIDGHTGVGDFYSRELRTSSSHQQGSFKALIGLNNSDLVHSSLAGLGDKLNNASSLATTRTSSIGRMQNKKNVKNFVVHPLAVEYTYDNAVAVATFLFELPGASSARIRSCFGSCMVLPSPNLQASVKV